MVRMSLQRNYLMSKMQQASTMLLRRNQAMEQQRSRMPGLVSMLLGGGLLYNQLKQQRAEGNECCGIVGYIGNRPQAGPICIQGL
jgi:hypothetical protein